MRRVMVVVGLLTAFGAAGIYAEPPKRVLLLHSYGIDFQWTRQLDEAIRQSLTEQRDVPLVIHSEFMDAKYHPEPEHVGRYARYLLEKYREKPVDLIISTDNAALSFLVEHRDGLFGPVPVVFAGVNGYRPDMSSGLDFVTGVSEELTLEPTIRYIERSLGNDRPIHIIGDGTATAAQNVEMALEALTSIQWGGRVTVHHQVTVDNIVDVRDSVEQNAVAMQLGGVRNSDDSLMDFPAAGRVLAEALNVPIFTAWDFLLGTGVVGGLLISAHGQGDLAAGIGLRILQGEGVETIPVEMESPNEWVFDYQALRRFRLNVSHLPAGARIVNKPDTLWIQHRSKVIAAILTIVTLSILVLHLMYLVRMREERNRLVRDSLEEKEALLKEIHHRVKNNLQLISSLLNIQSGAVVDDRSLSLLKDLEMRVHSIALIHEHLYQSSSLARVKLDDYIEDLLDGLRVSMAIEATTATITCDLESVEVKSEQALPVGLIVNELVSNAVKYAYPEGTGEIRVTVSQQNANVTVVVEDDGVGIPEAENRRTSAIGLQLAEALAAQIRGTLAVEGDGGVRAVLSFALDT